MTWLGKAASSGFLFKNQLLKSILIVLKGLHVKVVTDNDNLGLRFVISSTF